MESARHKWVEVRSTKSMGFGLFARQDITKGTRLLAERPIVIIRRPLIPTNVFAALMKLPMEERQKLDRLSWNSDKLDPSFEADLRQWCRDHAIKGDNGKHLKGKTLQNFSKAMTKRIRIVLNNACGMSDEDAGVFLPFSRINHSCLPNAANHYDLDLERLVVIAQRDIHAGEEIFVSYITGTSRPRASRQEELAQWGFQCGCHACVDPSEEEGRIRMDKIMQALDNYDVGANSAIDNDANLRIGSDNEALSYTEELVDLFKKHAIAGAELCNAYRGCIKYSGVTGDLTKAAAFARAELEAEQAHLGQAADEGISQMSNGEFLDFYSQRDSLASY